MVAAVTEDGPERQRQAVTGCEPEPQVMYFSSQVGTGVVLSVCWEQSVMLLWHVHKC
jgi:hypothetical protein